MNRSEFINQFGIRRVVLKIGTNLLLDARSADGISGAMLDKLRDEIIFLRERGIEVLLVSSGAVGSGRHFIKKQFNIPLHEQPSVTRKQALSAIGQHRLMARYESTFAPHGIPVAQLLLTAQDFRDRRAYLNMGHTISELMRLKALPIVNENDTVATDELLQFGENDILSAACLALFHADLLLILTSVDGFLLNNQRIPWISEISDEIRNAAGGPAGPGSGGMQAKIRAGELCAISGAALAILPGQHAHPVRSFFQGEDIGTLMVRSNDKRSWGRRLSARKSWLLFARTQG
ncbi:MAG: glutamate 5-kinase, partial [Leptospiraceae bacterium]|nr:glutamate 5-kinase [Leptospiraceae bacterium]